MTQAPQKAPYTTNNVGIPVESDEHSLTVGRDGPILLQDHYLIEKMAQFNRERVPERVVHAKGSGAYGFFEVTNDVSQFTKADLFQPGKRTEMLARFSTVAGEQGSPDTWRDPRGFALKFYTEQGNYDLVGNNTPIFFVRDTIKFQDFIRSQKRRPDNGLRDNDMQWDFWTLSPESAHQVTYLMGDRGVPKTYRNMNGYGSHTYMWINGAGERFWVKYHFKTDQGIDFLTQAEADELAGTDPDLHRMDLYKAIESGNAPSWSLKVQIMPFEDAADYRFNPFDLTKVWPHKDFPLQRVGRLVLDRNPDNVFAEVEQAAFSPNNFVPGIGPSPDKMLQGRLFAYADAHRYRLGVNHTQLAVNAPKATTADNYGRDGFMASNAQGRTAKNYEPNSYGGPTETGRPLSAPLAVAGWTGTHEAPLHTKDDDFFQAGELYRLMSAEERSRLIANIAGGLAQVSRDDVVEKNLAHFHAADPEYGRRVAEAVHALRED